MGILFFDVFETIYTLLGYVIAIAFIFFWAYAGWLVLETEKSIPLKIAFVLGMFFYPAITPILIYLRYYPPIIRGLRRLKYFLPKKAG